jgi:hypothetical protein
MFSMMWSSPVLSLFWLSSCDLWLTPTCRGRQSTNLCCFCSVYSLLLYRIMHSVVVVGTGAHADMLAEPSARSRADAH